jgi:hypothetical protein
MNASPLNQVRNELFAELRKIPPADLPALLDKWEKTVNTGIASATLEFQGGIPGVTEYDYQQAQGEAHAELFFLDMIHKARAAIGSPEADEARDFCFKALAELLIIRSIGRLQEIVNVNDALAEYLKA